MQEGGTQLGPQVRRLALGGWAHSVQYLFEMLVVKGDFGSPRLADTGPIIRGLLVS